MKRIIAVLLAVIMMVLTFCSCSGSKKENEQYVIALNPSVMFEDGKVNSLRNTVASAIQKDVNKNKTSLYESSNWKWVSRENDEENIVRRINEYDDKGVDLTRLTIGLIDLLKEVMKYIFQNIFL